jgi:hypothetical protein
MVSASNIANSSQGIYDIFSSVCSFTAYVPNSRLRELQHSACSKGLDVARLMQRIKASFVHTKSFRPVVGGSETHIVDRNLQMCIDEALRMAAYEDLNKTLYPLMCGKILASSTKSEPCISILNRSLSSEDIPGCVSEAKGLEASCRMCQSQLITVGGGAAINLKSLGLEIENAVIPAISLTDNFQFFGIYLMKDSFPVMTELTRCLDPLADLMEISLWLLKITNFVKETADLLKLVNEPSIPRMEAELSVGEYFFKPVRGVRKISQLNFENEKFALEERDCCKALGDNDSGTGNERDEESIFCQGQYDIDSASSVSIQALAFSPSPVPSKKYSEADSFLINLSYNMNVYRQLYIIDHAYDFILFPEGVITVPGIDVLESREIRDALMSCLHPNFEVLKMTHRPLIAFKLLSSRLGWSNIRPRKELHSAYLDQIAKAIEVMEKANVAHLDLRPSNIMWRQVDGSDQNIEIKIIDFEDAVMFGQLIPQSFIETVIHLPDYRYPFLHTWRNVERVLAVHEHNTFFHLLIDGWLTTTCEDSNFDEFMKSDKGIELSKALSSALFASCAVE